MMRADVGPDMRLPAIAALVLLALPLAAAHDENVIYRLEIPAGAGAGPILFDLHDEHRLLGIGVGGCTIGSVGVLRIATPTGGALEVTFTGTACSGTGTSLVGDPAQLAPGQYVGAYAFEAIAPILIVVYASEG